MVYPGLLSILVALDVLLIAAWLDYRTKRQAVVGRSLSASLARAVNRSGVEYGEPSPPFQTQDIHGHAISNVSIRGVATIFEFFRPELQIHRDRLAYADILARQYQGKVLFLAIGQGKLDWLLRKGFRLKHARMVPDRDFSLERLFVGDQSVGATIIVDGKGSVRFVSRSLVSNDLLRQLVGKFGQGS